MVVIRYHTCLGDVQSTLKATGAIVKDDDEEYLKIQKVVMKPDVGNMAVYFSNLVNGNSELGKNIFLKHNFLLLSLIILKMS